MPYNPDRDGWLGIDSDEVVHRVADPSTAGLKGTLTHRAQDVPLFTTRPAVSDIRQQHIGDCWFLSALGAILAFDTGWEVIQSIMRDYGDGTVAVRLYDDGLRERYVRMDKSLVTTTEAGTHYHSLGGLWVAVLEKAASYFEFDSGGGTYAFNPGGASYQKNLDFGNSHFALKMILGVPTRSTLIDFDAIWYEPVLPTLDGLLKRRAATPLLDEIFGQAAPERASYTAWITAHQVAVALAWEREKSVRRPNGAPQKSLRYEDLEDFLNKNRHDGVFAKTALSTGAVEAIMRWIGKKKLLPRKRGAAAIPGQLYSTAQLALLSAIDTAFREKRPVCLATPKYVGTLTGRGHSAGEEISKGLAGNHAYAVLGTEHDEHGRWYVTLANPWGNTGRSYTFHPQGTRTTPAPSGLGSLFGHQAKSYQVREGTFSLELNDVAKRFSAWYTCTEVPKVILRPPVSPQFRDPWYWKTPLPDVSELEPL